MDFDQFQNSALATDQTDIEADSEPLMVPMLGLASEAGELLGEYKKHLRANKTHALFQERVAEELGDLLWYIANIASKFDLSLSDIAKGNLDKTSERWGEPSKDEALFDEQEIEEERLPRQFQVDVIELEETSAASSLQVRIYVDGTQCGSTVSDNAHDPDGYRFHDVFHFAYAAMLGWSPVVRKLLDRKRKSKAKTDEVEDGGRATVIEEGIAALVFEYARSRRFLDGMKALESQLLRTITDMTAYLEVKQRTTGDWERAILSGFEVWRQVREHNGGRFECDLVERRITYLGPLSKSEKERYLKSDEG